MTKKKVCFLDFRDIIIIDSYKHYKLWWNHNDLEYYKIRENNWRKMRLLTINEISDLSLFKII